ncbi:FAD-dependent oxidoreductase [Bradyrhizobium cenepequi]|uniref:FAD-dependent oxidoreductase n=1 Tax=Bradyrhizobium cenepequi TaxID=2821403 RepID=UPI001CE2CFCD|nr:FAD-dependent oxidoreductase [Bradyrhizobium cenepequi]MCA6105996.1 FAD-dependent oxidoreductase [Bradyrhizobium cenepequi]
MIGNERDTGDTYECDVLVAGSGAAGMSAAITARSRGLDVLIVEKESRFGGTTARSGGWLWIPGTSLARAYGIEETPDQARTYLRHEAGNNYDAARVDAFLSAGPEAVDFFTTRTAVRFDMPLVFPDYHAEAPGGAQGGRSMVTRPFDGRELGEHIKTLGMPLPELTVFGMMLGSGKEIIHFMRATKSLTSAVYVAKRLSRHLMDVLRYGRGMTLTNGNALAGRLRKSALDLNIPMWLSSPVSELTVENGAVTGALVTRDGRDVRVRARRGVVLACGGFPHDVARRKKMFPHAPTGAEHYSPGPTGNTGDGLRLAETAGGRIERLPNAAAWVPVSLTKRKDGSSGVMPHFIDRAKPGVIAVMRDGKRFANEGNSYHDFVQAMMKAAKPNEEIAAFLICDHKTLRKYGLGCVPPLPMPIGHHLRTGYLMRGDTLEALAAQAGIDASGLVATVAQFNASAALGHDAAFGKGSKAYNRYQGDALHGPNPCVAPVARGPFYAVKMVIGDLGTYAGIVTDANARALDAEGRVIPGLYAAGNDMASIMGGNYPGAGITLGPALTFGYVAGRHLAESATERGAA